MSVANEKEEEITRQLVKKKKDTRVYNTTIEIKKIMENWLRLFSINFGWIKDFNKIILQYIKEYKLLKIIEGYDYIVNNAKFSPSGKEIIVSCNDGVIRIIEIKTKKVIKQFMLSSINENKNAINDAEFSLDGNMIVSCTDDNIQLWDVITEKQIKQFEENFILIMSVKFSYDNKMIVSSSADNIIRLWDINTGQQIKSFQGHSDIITYIDFSFHNQFILSSSYDKTIRLWNVTTGSQLFLLKGHQDVIVKSLFSYDCHFIVSCSFDKTIRLWDFLSLSSSLSSSSSIPIHVLKGHSDIITDIQFSPDHQTIISCSMDKTIRIWDIQTGFPLHTWIAHSQGILGLDISFDASNILTFSEDQTIRLWG
ncbi:hypothetical protein RFI_10477 [Reticulomyxa filosa]|uniref:Anaphase-promoting complex subunit 4-like WD40 domain-containing protein n=1 Tax=Reticulomyxa filosa TaxID=46433 RepID=X6NKY1_RETFI|nr:hypothetical protein RFI_10477 [Reticulomyxa filosa]|eukprot:ETO26656.1 hypothetical protein RFI_10477 [Reticulomyxa filosa]